MMLSDGVKIARRILKERGFTNYRQFPDFAKLEPWPDAENTMHLQIQVGDGWFARVIEKREDGYRIIDDDTIITTDEQIMDLINKGLFDGKEKPVATWYGYLYVPKGGEAKLEACRSLEYLPLAEARDLTKSRVKPWQEVLARTEKDVYGYKVWIRVKGPNTDRVGWFRYVIQLDENTGDIHTEIQDSMVMTADSKLKNIDDFLKLMFS